MKGRLVQQTAMRAGIARRMRDSKQQVPHFYLQAQVTMDPLLEHLRDEESNIRITVTAALARACVEALRTHPVLNAVWTDEGLLQADSVNLGIAIALDEGLLAPAILDAETLTLPQLASALSDLVERARARRLRPAEISDGTFTLSNLGMFDVSAFTAIIPPPQIGILATARPVQRVVMRDGEPTAVAVMTVTLSADHRAADGADAARFLETFKGLIEAPEALDVEPVTAKEVLT